MKEEFNLSDKIVVLDDGTLVINTINVEEAVRIMNLRFDTWCGNNKIGIEAHREHEKIIKEVFGENLVD